MLLSVANVSPKSDSIPFNSSDDNFVTSGSSASEILKP